MTCRWPEAEPREPPNRPRVSVGRRPSADKRQTGVRASVRSKAPASEKSPDPGQGGSADDAPSSRVGRCGRHPLAAARHSSPDEVDADERAAPRPPLVVTEKHVREHVERPLRPVEPHGRRAGRPDPCRRAARTWILHAPLATAGAGDRLNGWINLLARAEPRDVERVGVTGYDRGRSVDGALEVAGSWGHTHHNSRRRDRENCKAITARQATDAYCRANRPAAAFHHVVPFRGGLLSPIMRRGAKRAKAPRRGFHHPSPGVGAGWDWLRQTASRRPALRRDLLGKRRTPQPSAPSCEVRRRQAGRYAAVRPPPERGRPRRTSPCR